MNTDYFQQKLFIFMLAENICPRWLLAVAFAVCPCYFKDFSADLEDSVVTWWHGDVVDSPYFVCHLLYHALIHVWEHLDVLLKQCLCVLFLICIPVYTAVSIWVDMHERVCMRVHVFSWPEFSITLKDNYSVADAASYRILSNQKLFLSQLLDHCFNCCERLSSHLHRGSVRKSRNTRPWETKQFADRLKICRCIFMSRFFCVFDN